MKKNFLHKLETSIIILIFGLAIFTPLIIGIFEQDLKVSKIEKRTLSKLPKMPKTIKEIKKFPKSFDKYYSDHFGLRSFFTKYYKLAKYNIGDSPSDNITIGKDGWLFLDSIKKNHKSLYGDPIGDARNINKYTEGALKNAARRIMGINAWLNEKGVKYLFVIAPNKHTIYFDKLPYNISKINNESATDQLLNFLKKYTNVTVVDLRNALIKEKDKTPLYYKTGTHWNFMGGNIAQYEIMKVVQKMFPGKIKPELYDSSIFKKSIATDRGLETMAGAYFMPTQYAPYPQFKNESKTTNDYPKNNEGKDVSGITHTNVNADQDLNTVIFRDSFFRVLEPYFTRKFKHSTFIWEKISYRILGKYVNLKKPDIVIEEWVERTLPYVPKKYMEFENSLNKKLFNESNEEIFTINKKSSFKSNGLMIMDNTSENLKFKITGKNPFITLPLLPLKPNNKYVLRIEIISSIQAPLKIFYTDAKQSDNLFSNKHSISSIIKQGNKGYNDLYIGLNYPNLGKTLRLNFISNPGEMTIQLIQIKKIDDII